MRLQVRERGDEIHVDVDGVAGRQQHVLRALTECPQLRCATQPSALSAVNVRAGRDRMHICLKGSANLRFEAEAIYQCLREALIERQSAADLPAG